MSFISLTKDMDAPTMTSLLDYMSQRMDLCVKVISQDGRVKAVNRHGLALLGAEAQDICGKTWTAFWSGETRIRAEAAVASALAGQTDQFTARFNGTSVPTDWEIEAIPMEMEDGVVTSILVVSTLLSPTAVTPASDWNASDTLERLGGVLHDLSNFVSATSSSTRLLKNAEDATRVDTIADLLEDHTAKATDAIDALRDVLDVLKTRL